jgi:hypothetical protein
MSPLWHGRGMDTLDLLLFITAARIVGEDLDAPG